MRELTNSFCELATIVQSRCQGRLKHVRCQNASGRAEGRGSIGIDVLWVHAWLERNGHWTHDLFRTPLEKRGGIRKPGVCPRLDQLPATAAAAALSWPAFRPVARPSSRLADEFRTIPAFSSERKPARMFGMP